jgi:hypothetical protein
VCHGVPRDRVDGGIPWSLTIGEVSDDWKVASKGTFSWRADRSRLYRGKDSVAVHILKQGDSRDAGARPLTLTVPPIQQLWLFRVAASVDGFSALVRTKQ